MPFKKGQSGNPAGRPRRATARLSDLARTYTDVAIKARAEVCSGGSDSARVSAAVALLDRGYGKPLQTIEATVATDPSSLTEAELDSRIALALAGEEASSSSETIPDGVRTH